MSLSEAILDKIICWLKEHIKLPDAVPLWLVCILLVVSFLIAQSDRVGDLIITHLLTPYKISIDVAYPNNATNADELRLRWETN